MAGVGTIPFPFWLQAESVALELNHYQKESYDQEVSIREIPVILAQKKIRKQIKEETWALFLRWKRQKNTKERYSILKGIDVGMWCKLGFRKLHVICIQFNLPHFP
jgi:hypothetical protein